MKAIAGTILGEIQDSTLALAIILGFVALMVYRKPLGVFLVRVAHLSFRRGDTELTAQATAAPAASDGAVSEDEGEISEDKGPQDSLVRPEDEEDSSLPNEPQALRGRMISLLFKREEEEALRIREKLNEAEPDPSMRKADRARWEAIRHMTGSGGTEAMDALRRLTEDDQVSGTAWLFIGHCLVQSGELSGACEAYEKAIENARKPSLRTSAITSLAEAQAKAGRQDTALVTLKEAIRDTSDDDALFDLWLGLADVYADRDDHERRGIALQKALELRSHDTKARFRTAWSFSEGDSALAPLVAHHYEALLRFSPEDSTALNNYGVQMERLDMPMEAISLYRRSAERDYTLAMANLAYQYMGAGFASEAADILTKASAQESPHKNVAEATSALDRRQEKESQEKEKVLSAGQELAEFTRDLGTAMVQEQVLPQKGLWKWVDGPAEVSIEFSKGRLEISWTSGSTEYELSVAIEGRSGRGEFRKKAEKDYWMQKESEAFLIISPDGDSMRVAKLETLKITEMELRHQAS